MEEWVMKAETRDPRGKGGARTLRRNGRIPGVIYGAHKDAYPLAVEPREVEKVLRSEHGRNVILTLEVKGKGKESAMIRDWQVDPVRGSLLHVDFLRVAMDEAVRVKVAVRFKGEARGVKEQGGHIEVVHREVEIEALPSDIPEEFLVDVTPLELNQATRVSDLQVDSGKVKVLTDLEQVLVHVVPPRAVVEEAPAEEVAAEAAPTEPEVVKRGKAEEEETAEEKK